MKVQYSEAYEDLSYTKINLLIEVVVIEFLFVGVIPGNHSGIDISLGVLKSNPRNL